MKRGKRIVLRVSVIKAWIVRTIVDRTMHGNIVMFERTLQALFIQNSSGCDTRH